jgi:ribosomal protein S18 acetylase RimI-like enzyme
LTITGYTPFHTLQDRKLIAQSPQYEAGSPADPLAVTHVGERHRVAVTRTLASAFFDDPAIQWILRNEQTRAAALDKMFDWQFDVHRTNGIVSSSADGEVAALWVPPGKVHYEGRLTLPFLFKMFGIFGLSLARGKQIGDAIHAHLPAGENWLYLRYLGVHPDAQGKGWGGRAIRAGIAEANARGVPTCLETNNPENVGLYHRFGYRTISEWDVCDGGPHFWTMTRDMD